MSALDRLALDLRGAELCVDLTFAGPTKAAALIASPRGRDGELRFEAADAGEPGRFVATIDLRRVVSAREPGDRRFDLFVETAGMRDGPPARTKLGRSRATERPSRQLRYEVDGVDARVKMTPSGNVTLLVGADLPPLRHDLTTTTFRVRGTKLEVGWTVEGESAVAAAALVFRDRVSGAEVAAPLVVAEDAAASRASRGKLVHQLSGSVDVNAVHQRLAPSGYVPLTLRFTDDRGCDTDQHFAPPEGASHDSLPPWTVTTAGGVHHYVPYLTFKGSKVSLRVDQLDADAFTHLRTLLRWAWLIRLVRPLWGVWLVGELPDRAQDNGYHFFAWVRENHPSRRIYYVISADSPDRERVEALGNVVVRGSRQHVRYSMFATRLVSTHLPRYLLPTHDRRLLRAASGVKVFLQHGIMGTKHMVANYGRHDADFHADRFHVSSTREREMIVNDFGYRPRQVRVTGLPRFDSLLAPGPEPQGILILPSWREWLIQPEAVVGSEFLERWRSLLHSVQIRDALAEGTHVTFLLHPNLAHHTDLIDAPPQVAVVRPGEREVQDLLRQHQALITDYSSVGYDFALQDRPVYYYQFDRDDFLGDYPSHIDPVLDLPGFVTTSEDELLDRVAADRRQGFPMREEHRRRIRGWVDHVDRNNSERVHRSVQRAGGPAVLWRRLLDSDRVTRWHERFTNSDHHRRVMLGLFALARALPRKPTVVFESGNGRQYGGNPRAIYEELVRRDSGLATVWSTTSTFRPADSTTRKVAPRTARYYWELGRAKFWISDQNLGLDLRPAKSTFYLQTWHGTPLKRMQHDAVAHQGRPAGYLERVTQQTGYWSALLSPSPYATECFRSAFRFDGEILSVGYPRNDALVGEHAEERRRWTRSRLGVSEDQRLVLFAPTFRDNVRRGNRFAFRAGFRFEDLAEHLPEDMVVAVRAHHVAGRSVHVPPSAQDRVVDVTSYPDAQDLLAAADALVTDYSSMMFDYALTGRPLLFFCPDLDEYRDQLRGFYFDFEAEAPGPILRTAADLMAALGDLEGATGAHQAAVRAFASRYGPLDDGRASARVVDDLLARRRR